MTQVILFIFLISFSLEEGILKRSLLSKHGEDCVSDSACEEGLFCRLYRCMTNFESKNKKVLGLVENNICDFKHKCQANKKCIKHRCVDKNLIEEIQKKNIENEIDVNLLFAGSIILNQKAYTSGLKLNNTFNYDHLFEHISKDIKSVDLAIVEQETVFHINSDDKKFQKKITNTPKEIGDAIAKAGFKVVLHGTAYAYLQKEKGIINTLNFWKKYSQIHILGISSTLEESEKDYFIYNHKNLKIGIINFSGFAGNSIPKTSKFMVNTISHKKIQEVIGKLKKETDFIIVCMNWGEKNSHSPSKKLIQIAKLLARHGVNLIIGNHPFFIHPVTYIRAENGNKALVFWSLGLLVGDNKTTYNNIGALANIIISKGKGKGKAYLSSYNLIPIINHRGQSTEYSVYKLSDYTEELGLKVQKEFSLKKIKEVCIKLMGAFANCY